MMSPVEDQIPDIIFFGNILLDMTVRIDTTELLDRYGLTLDAQAEISGELLTEIADQVRDRPAGVDFNAGGSALNSCKIFRKLGTARPLFFGAVGNDKTAAILREKLIEQDVPVRLQVVDGTPTGQCICFAYGDRTGLFADIGASRMFNMDFFMDRNTNLESFLSSTKLQIFYIEGFFVPHRFEVCKYIVGLCTSRLKKLALNLSAAYIIRENIEEMIYLIKAASFIFGNEKEFMALSEQLGYSSLAKLSEVLLSDSPIVLVITNGSQKVRMYSKADSVIKYNEFDPKPVPMENIVDTTGAGDSLAAGFLNAFIGKQPLIDCLVVGCEIASKVVTQVGCNLP